MSLATEAMPETRSHFRHFPAVFATKVVATLSAQYLPTDTLGNDIDKPRPRRSEKQTKFDV